MGTSQFSAVVRALRTAVAAQPGYRLPGNTALGGITVYIGAQPKGTTDPGDYVVIGYVGDGDAGRWEQAQATMGPARSRDESGEIRCLASAQSGNPDPLDALDGAFAALAGVEAAVRADGSLGLVPGLQRLLAQVGGADVITWDTSPSGGHRADVQFTVRYEARI